MPVRRDKNGRWRYREVVQMPDGTKERISGTAPRNQNTKMACYQAMREHMERLLEPAQTAPEPVPEASTKEVPTINVFAYVFLNTYARTNNKPSEQINKESLLRTKIKPVLGERRLDEIRYGDVEDLKSQLLGRGLSAKTVNNTLTCLSKMLKYAADRELIDFVPRVTFLKVQPPDFDFLDFDEAERLLEAARRECDSYAMILLGVDAGLRVGEIRALQWDDIDLVRRMLTVQRTDYRGHLGTTKGGRIRRIPMTRRLTGAFKAHRHLIGPWVFCSLDGERLTRGEADTKLWRPCRRAGLRKVTWHVTRHTFCSHLAMRGASAKAIQELAGHASLHTTQRYMHLSPKASRQAIDLLESPMPEHSDEKLSSEEPGDGQNGQGGDLPWQKRGKK